MSQNEETFEFENTGRKRTLSIKSFRNAKCENILEVVEFTINAKHRENINVEALVSGICLPIENQAIEAVVERYLHIQNLPHLVWNSFMSDDKLLEQYDSIIKQQHSAGVIEEVSNYETIRVHYLPHIPVVKNEESIKVRMVFDASCRSFKGGDVLFAVPSSTESLEDVLIRFRSHNYVFSADIAKAFLKIGITPEHRDFIRFLWFKDTKNIDFEHFKQSTSRIQVY